MPRFVDHVTAAEARTFADQSVAALADVVQFGWAILRELKEPGFDAPERSPEQGIQVAGLGLLHLAGGERREQCLSRPRAES